MLIRRDRFVEALKLVLEQRLRQGCDLESADFLRRLDAAASSYDALYELAEELRDPPRRPDWPYIEPTAWDDIRSEAPQLDPQRPWPTPDLERAADSARAGFLGSVCGCMLGKPLEVDPTLAELKRALGEGDAWPHDDYVTEAYLQRLGRRHDSWGDTVREHLDRVVADDDIHYTVIGMLLLEQHGIDFSVDDLYQLWSLNLAPGWTWGPERSALLGTAVNLHHLFPESSVGDVHDVLLLNPGDEMCGALIRADAYGYACPGNPDLAAWLAWKDASFTHIGTGVYGAMFVAALIALCHMADPPPVGNGRLELVSEAARRIPSRARLAEVLADCVNRIAAADDWEAGYASVHARYQVYGHCQVYQEIGTLVNTLKFASGVGHGIGMQVSQGNDTDSFGATAGSVLGVLFGPDSLEERWLAPFGDRLQLGLAEFHEHSLNNLAGRVARLPALVHTQVQASV